jgi:hypothetical protein
LISLVRVFRIFRVLRLIKRARGLVVISNAILVSLPGLANIAALLFLILFFFSVLGMNLFAYVKTREKGITDKVII